MYGIGISVLAILVFVNLGGSLEGATICSGDDCTGTGEGECPDNKS